jgi:Subtilase family
MFLLKRTLLGVFLSFFCSHLLAQTVRPFYYYKSEKIFLEPNPGKLLVVMNDSTQKNDNDILRTLGLDARAKVKKNQKDNLSNKGAVVWTELEISGQSDVNTTNTLISDLNQNTNVKRANPYFRTKNGADIGLSHLFYIKLKSAADYSKLSQMVLSTQTEIGWQNEFNPLWYTLAVNKKSKGNALEMANYFFETGYFEIVEPSFVYNDISSSDNKPVSTPSDTKQLAIDNMVNCPTEPDFNLQWGLKNTGQNLNQLGPFANFNGTAGTDIKICEVRDITKGNSNIIVAVVDHPIQETHPDLITNIVQGFNTETNLPGNLTPIPTNHGTAVAGIIAAIDNNQLGITGIAPNSKLMSIAYNGSSSISFEDKARNGIIWAANNGAAVINNSWNTNIPSSVIDDGINHAVTFGRNGLGSISSSN